MADRVLVREPSPRTIVIDQNNSRRILRVRVGKIASAQKRDARRLKIARRDHQLPHVARVLELFRFRFAFQNKGADADVSRGRKRSRRARRFDARKTGQLRDKLREETRRGFVVDELRFGQTDAKGERPRWVHPEVGLLQKHETAHHQSRADEEDERERDFGDHERVTHPLALRAARASASAFLERVDQLRIRRLERRRQAEQHARDRADAERERKHPPVKIEPNPVRNFVRQRGQHQVHTPDSEEQTERAADHSEDETFRQQLPDDLPAGRAQGEADSNFFRARRAPSQEKIRHVRAGDQVHEKHRAHHEQSERLEISDVLFAERSHVHAYASVRIGMLRRDPRRDRFEFRAYLLDRDALLHFADAIEEEISARICFLLQLKRHPNVADLREPPAFRHHADDGDLLAVDRNRFPEHALVACEMFLPDLVADQRDGRSIQLAFFRPKKAAENRLYAHKRKGVCGNLAAEITLGFIAARDNKGRFRDRRDAIERGRVLFPLEVIGKGRAGVMLGIFGKELRDRDHPILVLDVRHRPEEERVDRREHRRRRANAESDRQNGDRRNPRGLYEHPTSVSKIS